MSDGHVDIQPLGEGLPNYRKEDLSVALLFVVISGVDGFDLLPGDLPAEHPGQPHHGGVDFLAAGGRGVVIGRLKRDRRAWVLLHQLGSRNESESEAGDWGASDQCSRKPRNYRA